MIRNTMIRRIQLAPIVLALGLVSGAAHAALQGRDLNGSAGSFEAYYDTDLDITWLADANYAQTSGYDTDGYMDWADVKTWAANLSLVDAVNNITYDIWRLPTSDTCLGYNCAGSEMGHLFYSELGGTAGQSILSSSDADVTKFTNLNVSTYYWSGTSTANAGGEEDVWIFSFQHGYQITEHNPGDCCGNDYLALAVSSGDVGAVVAVPEAQTYALMLAGLGLIGWRARRYV